MHQSFPPLRTRIAGLSFVALTIVFTGSAAAEFGSKDGPEPDNLHEVVKVLRQDPYDLELLISFGTSKGGSAGHIAIAVRRDGTSDDMVYSANFYADRSPEHVRNFYTGQLIVGIPKTEYLFKTTSSLDARAVFGLDYGEVYKRSVIGIRIFGVSIADKQSLFSYFSRINDDYHRRATNAEYHYGEVKYDYLRLNCAKIIGAAFKFGAGYDRLDVHNPQLFRGRRVVAAATANVPTEMALKLMEQWNQRKYSMDVVLYKKYEASGYIEPRDHPKIAFRNLPDRFPSVLSLDFQREQGEYRDFDNLFIMYLFYNLGRYSVRVDGATNRLRIEKEKEPMAYQDAVSLAKATAKSDSENYRRHALFRPLGTRIGEPPSNRHLYHYPDSESGPARP